MRSAIRLRLIVLAAMLHVASCRHAWHTWWLWLGVAAELHLSGVAIPLLRRVAAIAWYIAVCVAAVWVTMAMSVVCLVATWAHTWLGRRRGATQR